MIRGKLRTFQNMTKSDYQWIEFKVVRAVAEFFLLQIGFIWEDGRGYMMRVGKSDVSIFYMTLID